jgi:hypothetical protein
MAASFSGAESAQPIDIGSPTLRLRSHARFAIGRQPRCRSCRMADMRQVLLAGPWLVQRLIGWTKLDLTLNQVQDRVQAQRPSG